MNEAEFQARRRKWDKRDGVSRGGPSEAELEAQEAEKKADFEASFEALGMAVPGKRYAAGAAPGGGGGNNGNKGGESDDFAYLKARCGRPKQAESLTSLAGAHIFTPPASLVSLLIASPHSPPPRMCACCCGWARYYFEKLGITPAHADVHRAIRKHYLEGLLWCLVRSYRPELLTLPPA